MYSRTRADTEARLTIPENYDGTAFMEPTKDTPRVQTERSIRVLGECSAEAKMSPKERIEEPTDQAPEEEAAAAAPSVFFEKLPLLTSFSRWREIPVIKDIFPSKIGTEEILIIATALFLFFSKSGDKECAIMLGILLLVTK